VYLCALRAAGTEESHRLARRSPPTACGRESDRVRRAASIIALCETVEEAAGVPEADALLAAVAPRTRAWRRRSRLGEALAICEPPAQAPSSGRDWRANRE